MLPETATLDGVEGAIIRCLQLSPRIPFRAVAEILDISEQTVARRYRRMQRAGLVRVTAILRPTAVGQSNWIMRVRCKPSGAESLARALAQRDDISWVSLVSGGSEIACVLRSRTAEARDDLLMQRLPRTAPVLDITAAMVLNRFVSAGAHPDDDWSALGDLLTPEQERAVVSVPRLQPPSDPRLFDLQPEDAALIDVLTGDGRATYAQLAQAAGITETRAARRLRALVEGGAVYFDVDLSVSALGMSTTASLWMTVTPAELDRAGHALSAAPEVAFAAAITGPQNLTASIVCRDVTHLYSFVTDTVGAIPGVQAMEVAPILRHVKQAGSLTSGDRLAPT